MQSSDLRIYVISLAENNTRRSGLDEMMAHLGQHYEILDAVDGRDGLDSSLEAEIDREAAARIMRYHMSDGCFACALSHRKAHERFLDSDGEWALFLEDDAILDARIGKFIAAGSYRAAPMMLLYHAKAWVLGKGAPVVGTESRSIPLAPHITQSIRSPVAGESRTAPMHFFPQGTVAYTINRFAAQSLVEAQSPVCASADWPIDLATLGAQALVPPIVDHPPFESVVSHLESDRAVPPPLLPLIEKMFIPAYWRRKWSKLRGARKVS